jgi:hypothetical protein
MRAPIAHNNYSCSTREKDAVLFLETAGGTSKHVERKEQNPLMLSGLSGNDF